MVGRVNGVSTQLLSMNPLLVNIHCVAHRLSLASSQAGNLVKYLTEYQSSVKMVYNFYQYSAVRYEKIRELKKVMKVQAKNFKKPTSVRWLSTYEAIEAVHSAWGVLVMALEHEAHVLRTTEAKGILTRVNNYKFLATTCMLKDVLLCIIKLSKVLQSDTVDVGRIVSMVKATKDTITAMIHTPGETLKDLHEQLAKGDGQFQGVDVKGFNDHQKGVVRNMTEKYINNLVTNLDKRFPEAMDIVNCMNTVLNPNCLPESAKGIINHGERELGVLMKHFGTETTVKLNHATIVKMKMIDGERLKRDFLQFKYLLNVHRVQTDIDLIKMSEIIITKHQEDFPDFAKLCQFLCTIPLSSVPCERGFSGQNRVHNSKRNRLGVTRLERKMRISSVFKAESLSIKRKFVGEAAEVFLLKKKRRKI